MDEIIITTKIQRFEHPGELQEVEQVLLLEAEKALEHSYSPYSGFAVGASVLLSDGSIETGSNQENAAYPMCLCAERVALSAAASRKPGVPVHIIAIRVRRSDKILDQPAGPCGACRQTLSEWEDRFGQDIMVLLQGEKGPIYRIPKAKDLLPLSFDGSFL